METLRSAWRPAAPPRRPVLLINPRSGGGRRARRARRARARAGNRGRRSRTGQDLATVVREAVASGADALGMAGGDGSLAVVAAAACRHGLPFVCVPAGTRNHFAQDLGIDRRDVIGALRAFTDGVERRIDIGLVNGRLFLNNVSLGLYGDAVQQAAYRDAKLRSLVATANAVVSSKAPAPRCKSSTIAAKRTAIRPLCWCRTTRTRSSRRRWRGRGRGSTPRDSGSSCSTRREPSARPGAGVDRAVRGARGDDGACRHRRRGRGAGCARALRDPAARLARADLVAPSARVSPSGRLQSRRLASARRVAGGERLASRVGGR